MKWPAGEMVVKKMVVVDVVVKRPCDGDRGDGGEVRRDVVMIIS